MRNVQEEGLFLLGLCKKGKEGAIFFLCACELLLSFLQGCIAGANTSITVLVFYGVRAFASVFGAFPRKLKLLGFFSLFSIFSLSSTASGFDCLIEANQLVELGSPVSGVLDKVNVRRGDVVRKGQVLAQLDARAEAASADLARYKSEQVGPTRMAESKIEFARKKYGRRKDMAAEKLVSPQDRDDAEAELRLAEAELVVAKDNKQIARYEYQQQSALLALRTIRSPFDGVVADQLAYPGEVIELGGTKKTILKVAQLDPLRVHVILPKEAFGRISIGSTVDISTEMKGKNRYVAKVRSIDRLIDAASGSFVTFLDLPNPSLDIPAGIKCRAAFQGLDPPAPSARPKPASPANQ